MADRARRELERLAEAGEGERRELLLELVRAGELLDWPALCELEGLEPEAARAYLRARFPASILRDAARGGSSLAARCLEQAPSQPPQLREDRSPAADFELLAVGHAYCVQLLRAVDARHRELGVALFAVEEARLGLDRVQLHIEGSREEASRLFDLSLELYERGGEAARQDLVADPLAKRAALDYLQGVARVVRASHDAQIGADRVGAPLYMAALSVAYLADPEVTPWGGYHEEAVREVFAPLEARAGEALVSWLLSRDPEPLVRYSGRSRATRIPS